MSPRRRRLQAATIVVLMVAGVGWLGYRYRLTTPGPQQVVQAYFDHLDFNRRQEAYDLLDPRTRPGFAAYQADLSRDGGLVASFGKLDDITTRVARVTSAGVTISASLTFLTSLEEFHMTRELTLRRTGDDWRIDLPLSSVYEPPDTFTQRPAVSFLQQRPQTNAAQRTDVTDITRAPEVAFRSVRTLRLNGRWIVVGEVVNMDVVPVDLTVNAQIRDSAGRLLASWDAAQVLIHKLLSGESSPFRIEFQMIAGTGQYGTEVDGGVQRRETGPAVTPTASPSGSPAPAAAEAAAIRAPVEFDPAQITPLVLDGESVPARVDVYARGSVTSLGTTRGLQVSRLALELAPSGNHFLTGVIRNDMTVEAAIPHLLLAYLSNDRQVGWVDHAYLPNSIAPQRSTSFRIPVSSGAGIRDAGVPTKGFAGSNPGPVPRRMALVDAPEGSRFAKLQLYVTAYIRGGK